MKSSAKLRYFNYSLMFLGKADVYSTGAPFRYHKSKPTRKHKTNFNFKGSQIINTLAYFTAKKSFIKKFEKNGDNDSVEDKTESQVERLARSGLYINPSDAIKFLTDQVINTIRRRDTHHTDTSHNNTQHNGT
jgi:hypothetical protein